MPSPTPARRSRRPSRPAKGQLEKSPTGISGFDELTLLQPRVTKAHAEALPEPLRQFAAVFSVGSFLAVPLRTPLGVFGLLCVGRPAAGAIDVKSEPGKGSEFRVLLPWETRA